MKYNELVASKQKLSTRVGRGISAGGGKTAGRGTKGQGARKSPGKAGFEGGQMPIYMRLPKLRGFKSKRDEVETVYTSNLDAIKKTIIDSTVLAENKLISNPYVAVKLLVGGKLTTKKTVKLYKASKEAIKAIEAAGGTYESVNRLGRSKKVEDK